VALRRLAVLLAGAAALTAVTSAGAELQPVRRASGELAIPRVRAGVLHVPARQSSGRVRVVVRLALSALAARDSGFRLRAGSRLDVHSSSSRAYLARLARAQDAAVAALRRAIPEARPDRRYRVVFDGFAVSLPVRSMPRLVKLGFVDRVFPSLTYAATLNDSPGVIGAPQFSQATGDGGQGTKIAIVDTGVDPTNPFFAPAGYEYPPGFPKGGRKWTSPKVIVARTFPGPGAGKEGRQAVVPQEFHGTHVAGIAAGNAGTVAPSAPSHPAVAGLSGVAPRAWIGNYRVFTIPTPFGRVGNTPEIIAAFEQAVVDGMDVINFSGGGPPSDPENDALVEAVRNVAAAGVVPVIAAGNDREDFGLGTVGSPGTAPDAISVAAVTNSHVFAEALSLTAPGAPSVLSSIPVQGTGAQNPPQAWSARDQTLVDLRSVIGTDGRPADRFLCAPPGRDPNGPATTLAPGSLNGAIVLAWRGMCSFDSKAERAKSAGAAGMLLVDNRPGDSSPIPVEGLRLPSGMIGDLDGARVGSYLQAVGGRTTFRVGRDISEIVTGRSGVVASFSSGGPTAFEHQLKPDVAAPGTQVLSATPPSAATRATFYPLDGTSMATPHVAGAAALLLDRHPSWTAQQVKSALVSTAGPAWADSARTQEASVLLEGGGLIDVRRADDPQLFTNPASLSFGDLNVSRGSASTPLLLALSDAGDGAGSWDVEVRPQSATAGATIGVPSSLTLTPGGTLFVSVVARGEAGAAVGDDYGFLVLRRGDVERRVPYFFSVTRPQLPLAPLAGPLKKLQTGDTRTGVSHVSSYRYPTYPFGPPPGYAGPGMDESGSEHVYTVRAADPAVNVGVSVLAAGPNALVHPWMLSSLDENSVMGFAGTPVNVNNLTVDWRFDVGAAGTVFPRRQQRLYVVVDSGSNRFTGEPLRGEYVLNAWQNDVFPPSVRFLTTRVSAGRPLLAARALDFGAGVDPYSLVVAYGQVLVGAAAYDPTTGLALFPLPPTAPALDAGTTTAEMLAADFQESKNVDTLGGAILPNTTFARGRLQVVDGPAVTWLLPTTGLCAGKNPRLLVTASSTQAVRRVRFAVDGHQVAVDRTGPATLFSATWRTAGVRKSRHVLEATATDGSGRSASARETVRSCG
jgi:minor extracellular serine protease Vpr